MSDDTDTNERLLYADRLVRISLRMPLRDPRTTPHLLFTPGDAGPVVTLVGEIDVSNCTALTRALTACRAGGGHVTVDTGRLTFIDLAGLRALIMPALPAPQRWVRLRNVTPYQERLLHLIGWLYELDPEPDSAAPQAAP
ncbi:STAS domain-containing protein [Nonomuraea sp. SMC257]|uniref:STAS domain-containing protein n=1 Tax=Nonomuraea montanisoli TaxID=2741721 RepID=A0A7Y6I6K4_9ACTN|nr:STAS domain-containing protein [Nonomuraea montanisoli]NUW32504.1 STAS domain-containing protein [Nonomuraea montanisoli]